MSTAAGPQAAQPPEITYDFQLEIPDTFVPLPTETGESPGDLAAVGGAQTKDGGATGDGSDAGEAWREAVEALLPGLEGEQRAQAGQALRHAIADRTPTTTLNTALCLGTTGDEVTMAVLTVAVQHSGHDSAVITAEALYQSYKERFFVRETRPPAEIDTENAKGLRGSQDTLLATRLPCGPGVTVLSLRTVSFPQQTGAEGPGLSIPVGIQQLIIPAPENYCVYVTLLTPTLTQLALYSGQLSAIAGSVRFGVEAAASTDEDAGGYKGAGGGD